MKPAWDKSNRRVSDIWRFVSLRAAAQAIAGAVEMPCSEKNRLPSPLTIDRYKSKAKAVLPAIRASGSAWLTAGDISRSATDRETRSSSGVALGRGAAEGVGLGIGADLPGSPVGTAGFRSRGWGSTARLTCLPGRAGVSPTTDWSTSVGAAVSETWWVSAALSTGNAV